MKDGSTEDEEDSEMESKKGNDGKENQETEIVMKKRCKWK